jgi:hypothetical protein
MEKVELIGCAICVQPILYGQVVAMDKEDLFSLSTLSNLNTIQ